MDEDSGQSRPHPGGQDGIAGGRPAPDEPEQPGEGTGQIIQSSLQQGTAEIVNAGHPRPLRLRDGTVERVDLHADPALGMVASTRYQVQRLGLEPGDRPVFLTDGMLERNASRLDIVGTLAATADLHPREVVHELSEAVLDTVGGDLRDDAAVMCIDWHGAEGAERHSVGGASRAPANGPLSATGP